MSRSRKTSFAVLSVAFALIGLACGKTYVVLGKEASSAGSTGGAGGVGGVAGMVGGDIGGTGGTGGAAGIFAGAGGISGVGGFGGGSCAPSEETLQRCGQAYLPFRGVSMERYGYNACLNLVMQEMVGGVGGGAADQCEGYPPCSDQHEGCLFFQTDGAAGSNNGGCAGAPGDEAWLQDCGGYGYYGPDIVDEITGGSGGASGTWAGGGAGSTAGAGGEAGSIAGEGGAGATGGAGGGCAGAPGDPAYDACANGSGGAAGN